MKQYGGLLFLHAVSAMVVGRPAGRPYITSRSAKDEAREASIKPGVIAGQASSGTRSASVKTSENHSMCVETGRRPILCE
jgi:hypothetical protein